MKPLFHTATGNNVANFLNKPSHAVLLYGPEGAGKGTVATYIASQLLDITPAQLSNHPYTAWLHDQQVTPIEDIRSLQKLMQLKVPGTHQYRRAVIIEQAQTMSKEAQNAFLKLLEEPPEDTLIILTVTDRNLLLDTILSRLQQIRILALSQETVESYYQSQFTSAEIDRAFHLSDGYIGLIDALLHNNQDHPLVEQIAQAKNILASNRFLRLAQVDAIVKQKNLAVFLQALQRVCHAALVANIQKEGTATAQWKHRLQATVQAQQRLSANPQAKLLLTDLFLSL